MRIDIPDTLDTSSAKILDAGGWFIPFKEATHVVDLMPYETREGVLQLNPMPRERFTKTKWHQANFLSPDLRLPYPDKFFDYSVCGHTVEDLADPVPLLAELRRVSKAGYIETPSRISEQTIGVRDRMTDAQGHPHHHWIVEAEDNKLLFSSKEISLASSRKYHAVPLQTYENLFACKKVSAIMSFQWKGYFSVKIISDDEATNRAFTVVKSCAISRYDRTMDLFLRRLRKLRSHLFHPAPQNPSEWWQEMVRISLPYSSITL